MKIAVLGGYGVGITMLVPRMPDEGETVLGGRLSHEHGGKGSNQAIAMTRWGAQAELISAVGDDAAGSAAHDLWMREGVGATAVRTVDAPTMTGIILVDAAGENRIAIAPGALDALTTHDIDAAAELIEEASALVISLEVPAAVALRAVEVARAVSVPVVLNPAPAHDIPEALWMAADVLIPNQSEARTLLGAVGANEEDLVLELHERTQGTVVLTCGARGAVIADDRGLRWVPGVSVDAVDTTGAGDTFVAVLTVEYLEGKSIDAAVEAACAAAATSVTTMGVVPGLPFRPARVPAAQVAP